MCDPEMLECTQTCPCWTPGSTVGEHDGHCCMLRDGHATPPAVKEWRTGADECQPPATVSIEVPC